MSSTQIIYVSKDKAQISNAEDGSFMNMVDNGIIVKEGDEISIEGIAINSTGVGNDIVEIPTKIQNYDYKTNRMVLNTMLYVNHNYEMTCGLPLSVWNAVYTDATKENYGYMTNLTPIPTLPMITGVKSKNTNDQDFAGKKFYLGSYGVYPTNSTDNPPNPFLPIVANVGVPITDHIPGVQVFNFCESNIDFGVDFGYDNPSNIANKITQDFHAAEVSPISSELSTNSTFAQSLVNDEEVGGVGSVAQLACATYDTACINIKGYPFNWNSQANYSVYDGLIGTSNPFYMYYGSRLLCGNAAIGGVGAKYTSFMNSQTPNNPPHSNDVYLINTPPTAGATPNQYTLVPENYIFATNLPYNGVTLNLLRGFIQSQWKIKYVSTLTPNKLKTKDLDLQNYEFAMDIGRYDDAPAFGTAVTSPALYAPATASVKEYFTAQGSYNEERFSKAFININDNDFKIETDFIVNYFGVNWTAEKLCKKLNISVIPVNTGNSEVVCGFIMNTKSLAAAVKVVNGGEYALVDLSFFNPKNNQICMANPQVRPGGQLNDLDDYGGIMFVGSPNLQMLFDSTRGRFGLSYMAWGNTLNNEGVTAAGGANPAAGQRVITTNSYLKPTQYNSTTTTRFPFTKYALCGLSIRNISVITETEDHKAVEIDYYDEFDIVAKWSGSLLERLGFTYNQLTNKNGIPQAIFTQRCYNSVIPITNTDLFPSPLTTNLRFDTSICEGFSVIMVGALGALPMFDMGGQCGNVNINIQAEEDTAFALNLPQKLVFPYWLIKSDIIGGVLFNSENNGGQQSVMAICNRAYLSGDFAFSFATDYSFKATKEFVITGINTSILNPDLTPADINNKTSILYKIVSPIPYFANKANALQIEAQAAKKK